ncbi:RNA polymerase sigma-70 factor [Pedobacter sp. SYP-B3415]|uniref:RNA polymerase sigma-70 factor n=1 Tax=Pedobacter sp. SYP-B3415 TaxID=2496641 RepID=UPI00101C75C2|nr:RNA polymerase sigma-70 factor [Pedobacter sp. SYP-B3415]
MNIALRLKNTPATAKLRESLYLSARQLSIVVQPDDYTRIDQIKQGHKAAFDQVFLEFYKHLHAYANNMLKDSDAAEEAVQNVFCRIWERRAQLNAEGYLKSFLYRAVHNECLNNLKHQKVRSAFQLHYANEPAESPAPDEHMQASELERQIFQAIEELPLKCREIFRMSRMEQLRYHEIATALNISVKTVENQMGKALRVLRVKLADFLPLFFAFLLERI